MAIKFSEVSSSWTETPKWVEFLISFGFEWIRRENNSRQIALISMPCDSAAAGLVALGAMRKYLEDPGTNDISLHLQRIRNERDKILLHREKPGKKFRYDGIFRYNEDYEVDRIVEIDRPRNIDRRSSNSKIILNPVEVRFEDEPFLEVDDSQQLAFESIYRKLSFSNGDILEDNLCKTHSGVCLAGRVMGESRTRDILSSIRFRYDDSISVGLDQLLSVHAWSHENVSRVSFFNSRTNSRDRETPPPSVVVADGDGALLTVLDHNLFAKSDVIAIIDRTFDRDRLEAIDQKMASMSQWYVRNEVLSGELPAPLRGISVATWEKR